MIVINEYRTFVYTVEWWDDKTIKVELWLPSGFTRTWSSLDWSVPAAVRFVAKEIDKRID